MGPAPNPPAPFSRFGLNCHRPPNPAKIGAAGGADWDIPDGRQNRSLAIPTPWSTHRDGILPTCDISLFQSAFAMDPNGICLAAMAILAGGRRDKRASDDTTRVYVSLTSISLKPCEL